MTTRQGRRPEVKRFARRNRSRRWSRFRPIAIVSLALLLLGGAAWGIWFSSLLDVRELRVVGAQSLSEEAVAEAADVSMGTPLARVDLAAAAKGVRSLSPVRTVDVDRSWPNTVRVTVRERTAVAVLDRGGAFDLVDAEGVPFRPVVRRPEGMPILEVDPDKPQALEAAAAAVDTLPAKVSERTKKVQARSADSITLMWADDVTVIWGSADRSERKAEVLSALLEQDDSDEVATYDVSVPDLPTTKKQ